MCERYSEDAVVLGQHALDLGPRLPPLGAIFRGSRSAVLLAASVDAIGSLFNRFANDGGLGRGARPRGERQRYLSDTCRTRCLFVIVERAVFRPEARGLCPGPAPPFLKRTCRPASQPIKMRTEGVPRALDNLVRQHRAVALYPHVRVAVVVPRQTTGASGMPPSRTTGRCCAASHSHRSGQPGASSQRCTYTNVVTRAPRCG
jgi:hypothetical protein